MKRKQVLPTEKYTSIYYLFNLYKSALVFKCFYITICHCSTKFLLHKWQHNPKIMDVIRKPSHIKPSLDFCFTLKTDRYKERKVEVFCQLGLPGLLTTDWDKYKRSRGVFLYTPPDLFFSSSSLLSFRLNFGISCWSRSLTLSLSVIAIGRPLGLMKWNVLAPPSCNTSWSWTFSLESGEIFCAEREDFKMTYSDGWIWFFDRVVFENVFHLACYSPTEPPILLTYIFLDRIL
jgi:hypothetical protein